MLLVRRGTWPAIVALCASLFAVTAVAPTTASADPVAVTRQESLSVGLGHSCAIIEVSASVTCWGYNAFGQLGDGTTTTRPNPVVVRGLAGTTAMAITSGFNHSCALLADTTVRCWGENSTGAVGDGTTTDRDMATPVQGLSGVIQVEAGAAYTCAVMADSTVKCWGANYAGQLGDGTTTDHLTPTTVPGLTGVASVSAGGGQTCAVRSVGTVACWGANSEGAVGDGTTTDRHTPVTLAGLSGVTALSAGPAHTCAVMQDATVRCWGQNTLGQLGVGDTAAHLVPTAVALTGVAAVSAGSTDTCAVRSDGSASCWGYNVFGEVGDGTTTPRTVPTPVAFLSGAVSIGAGDSFACALIGSDGSLDCWGANSFGTLGDGTATASSVPVRVLGLRADTPQVGDTGACVRTDGNFVRCWDETDDRGQLGDGTIGGGGASTPVYVDGIRDVYRLSERAKTVCAILNPDLAVKCWGANDGGMLGRGTVGDSATPDFVSGLTGVFTIDAGRSHVCGTGNNVTWCWGRNSSGELGDGTTTDRSTPVSVSGTSFESVSTGDDHTCGVVGISLYCWGDNSHGQLGPGITVPSSSTPALVSGIRPVYVSAGGQYSCVEPTLPAKLTCWGANAFGQLGSGSTGAGGSTPVEHSSPWDFDAGPRHACALFAAQRASCWGSNDFGSVAAVADPVVPAPLQVSSISFSKIRAGLALSCALLTTVPYCWGKASALGRDASLNSSAPASIGPVLGFGRIRLPLTVSVPSTPTGVATAESGATVTVSWVDQPVENFYEIQRQRWNGSAGAEAASFTQVANTTQFVDATLPDGQYVYLGRAVNALGASAWASAVIVHSTATTAPPAPTGLTITTAGPGMTLHWADNATNEQGYEVQRARWAAGVWTEWTSWSLDKNVTSFTDSPVPDAFYAYLVRARNTIGTSSWLINVHEHTTSSAPPAAPTGIAAAAGNGNVVVTWTDHANNEHLFDVGRARYNPTTGQWGEWTFWAADIDATSFTDVHPPDGQFAYLVRARNPNGASDWAITVIAYVHDTAVPTQPALFTVGQSGADVVLGWTDFATDELVYEVQRARWNGSTWVDWTTRVLDLNTQAYTDPSVPAGRYAYLVRATNPNGSSAWLTQTIDVH